MSGDVVFVKVRYAGNTYTAQAGRGRKAKRASCTMGVSQAAQAAAAKWFGLDSSNTVKPGDLVAQAFQTGVYRVSMPSVEGGAK